MLGPRAGLIAADAALARGMVTGDQLEAAVATSALGHGRRNAELVVRLADPRSESPGESWTRLLFHQLGLTPMEPPAVIRDPSGRFVARVDLLDHAHRLVVEFDGAVKYGGAAAAGQATLVAEKPARTRCAGSARWSCASPGVICSIPPGCSASCRRPGCWRGARPELQTCHSSPGCG